MSACIKPIVTLGLHHATITSYYIADNPRASSGVYTFTTSTPVASFATQASHYTAAFTVYLLAIMSCDDMPALSSGEERELPVKVRPPSSPPKCQEEEGYTNFIRIIKKKKRRRCQDRPVNSVYTSPYHA